MSMRGALAPSAGDIEVLADAALREVPERFRRAAAGVVIRVEEFPDEDTMQEMALESPFDILGLYRGVSLDHKSGADAPDDVDMVLLYRRPLLDYWCESGESLDHLVRHVLIHEIGHHFGFSDDDMDAIEADTQERTA